MTFITSSFVHKNDVHSSDKLATSLYASYVNIVINKGMSTSL